MRAPVFLSLDDIYCRKKVIAYKLLAPDFVSGHLSFLNVLTMCWRRRIWAELPLRNQKWNQRVLFYMGLLVCRQMAPLGVSSWTMVAFIRLFSGMYDHVLFQTTFLIKCGGATVAFIWLFTSVNSCVHFQMLFSGKCRRTAIAFKSPFTWMSSFVW